MGSFPLRLAALLIAAYAHDDENLRTMMYGHQATSGMVVRPMCEEAASGMTVCEGRKMSLVSSPVDVRAQLCGDSAHSASASRALGCNKSRALRDGKAVSESDMMMGGNVMMTTSTDSAPPMVASSGVKCSRFFGQEGVEGIHCEHAVESVNGTPGVSGTCHRYVTADGESVNQVHCNMSHAETQEQVFCTRGPSSGEMITCPGSLHASSSPTVCESVNIPMSAGLSRECAQVLADEEYSVNGAATIGEAGVQRRMNKNSGGADQVTVIRLDDYYGKAKSQSRPAIRPLTAMPHNPWKPENIREPPQPVIHTAPYRAVAPTPIMLLDHQMPSGQSSGQAAGGQSYQMPSSVTRSSTAPKRRLNLVAPNSRPRCDENVCGPSVASAPTVVVQRDAVTSVVRETSCPQGMSFEGNLCVGLDMCPVVYSCPSGYAAHGDLCITETQPLVECPSGYNLHAGNVCTLGRMYNAKLLCPQDYRLDMESRVCLKDVPVPASCSAGFTLSPDGISCTQHFEPQLQCPAGMTLSPTTKDCVSSSSEEAGMLCPEGASVTEDKRCVVVSQQPPRCQPGFTYDAKTESCIQQVSRKPAPCPQGFTRGERGCERVEKAPATPSCPSNDYVLKGDKCVLSVAREPTCPDGYHRLAGEKKCLKQVDATPTCLEGKLRKNEGCVVQIEHPSIDCCAAGFSLKGTECERVEKFPAEVSCDGECYRARSYPVAYACPHDSEFVPHPKQPKCVRKVSEVVCQEQCVSADGEPCVGGPFPFPIPTDIPAIPTLPPSIPTLPPSVPTFPPGGPTVPPVPTPQGGARGGAAPPADSAVCQNVISSDTVAAEPYCANGGSLENGRCVVREPIVPERTCKIGELDEISGMCQRTVVAPMKSRCPSGTTRVADACVSEEIRTPTFVCPNGDAPSAAGTCQLTEAPIPQPPEVRSVAVAYNCPKGAVLSGKECSFTAYVEPPAVCPPEAEEVDNMCFVSKAPIITAPIERNVRPSFYCANPDAQLNGRVCSLTQHAPAERVCGASDSSLVGPVCRRVAEPIRPAPKVLVEMPRAVCEEPNAELRGCMCLKHDEVVPLMSCPNGYQLNSAGACERAAAKQPVCPLGTEMSGDACVRRVELAPIVRIINGCEVKAPNAVPVCYNGY